MTPALNPQCQVFDDLAEDLALGMVDEPQRSALLDHADACPRCRSTLDGLGSVVDRLLLVAPEVEPPGGFETRVLARLGASPSARGAAERTRVPRWSVVAAALVLLAAGFGVGRAVDGGSTRTVRSAAIVTAAGADVGTVQLLDQPVPHVLVTVTAPRPNPGLRHCQLLLGNGRWVEVGTWKIADLAAGVWAVGITPAQLDAAAMRVTDDTGKVLASATFR